MAEDVVAARGAVIEIESAVADTWLDLTPYLESMEPDYSHKTQRQDVDAWKDQGYANDRVTGRGLKFSIKTKVFRDTVSAELAPVLARLAQLGRAQLAAGQSRVRWREHEDLTEWEVWECNVDLKKKDGGAVYDLAPIEAEIFCCGAPTYVAVA